MNYALNDRITIVVDKGQGPGLVGDGQGELVVIHQADLLNLAGVVHVVQEDGDAQHFKRSVNFEMSFWCHQIDQKTNGIFVRISALVSKKKSNQK
jgi:hypothetical protein